MYTCQAVHIAHLLSNFVFCTVTLPRRCCHLCCIFISLSLVVSAAYCKSHITLFCWLCESGSGQGYAVLMLLQVWVCFLSFETFFHLLHPVFTICILMIHFKYFYNPLNCVFNSVNCTKFTFCSNTQSGCSLFVLLQPTAEKIISFQMTFIFLLKPFECNSAFQCALGAKAFYAMVYF